MVIVENTLKLELVYREIEPGDALFFHGNLLHWSLANLSTETRWPVIYCYSLVKIGLLETFTLWRTAAANSTTNEKSYEFIH